MAALFLCALGFSARQVNLANQQVTQLGLD